jgi:hypothetical protein
MEMSMKKFKKSFYVGALITTGFLAVACGKISGHYNQKGAAASQSAATIQTPTFLQGQWTNCTNGALTTYSFTGNGYWLEVDQYSSSDCSDSNASSLGNPEEGQFTLGNAPQQGVGTGTAVTISWTPYYASTDSDGTNQSGTVSLIGSNLLIVKNGISLYCNPQTSSNSNNN